MDAVRLNAKIEWGRGKAAQHLGLACTVFRPLTDAPLVNQVATLKAAFNAANETYTKPNAYGKPLWWGDFDGRKTLPGDYLVRSFDGAIWFIAGQPQLLPVICVDCQRSVSLARQSADAGLGAIAYSGVVAPTTILGVGAAWPCAIVLGGAGGEAAGLPADASDAGWRVYLPVSVPITIESTDFITDDLGRRFEIEAAELTELGWRLVAKELHT